MSLKARLKTIEGRLPESRAAAAKYKPEKTDLLIFDYEEYRKAFAAYVMALYIEDQEQAEEMERKVEYLQETMKPISKPSQYDEEKSSQLMAVKIVDWMEENDFKGEIDEHRWEELFNGAENQAE